MVIGVVAFLLLASSVIYVIGSPTAEANLHDGDDNGDNPPAYAASISDEDEDNDNPPAYAASAGDGGFIHQQLPHDDGNDEGGPGN